MGGLREFTTAKPIRMPGMQKWKSLEMVGGVQVRLGAFSVHVNGWIYHADLGWVYAVGDDQEGLWLWTRERFWLWTSEQSWPYLWQYGSS